MLGYRLKDQIELSTMYLIFQIVVKSSTEGLVVKGLIKIQDCEL